MAKPLSEMTLKELWELFPIILKEHNEAYKDWYLSEKDRLYSIMDKQYIKRISHIGSSAVKGLIAKPTIDILMEIRKDCNVEHLSDMLRRDNWGLMSTDNKPDMLLFQKGYTPDGFAEKVYHLHVRYFGDWDELYFRDYLMQHDDVARAYGKLKMSLLKDFKHNRDGYTQAKSDFVLEYTQKAREEFADRYAGQK